MSSRRRDGERPRRDYSPRSEEKSHRRRTNPPSRHLFVGNLSPNLTESILANHFLRFGDLESVAFQPGRNYAFINFTDEEGAFAAMRELQGLAIAGNPLRIEFTKAEKSSAPARNENYLHRRTEERSMRRGSPYSERDFTMRHSSPDRQYLDKTKLNDKNTDPSEVLWIGFPAQLKVDEFTLRKAFSPFGEIEKISAFPGRSYAFVRFRNIIAACRAKETLQGKLFGSPRVHICFARSESNRERDPVDAPPLQHPRSHGTPRSERVLDERYFGNMNEDVRSRSEFISDFEAGHLDVGRSSRNSNLQASRADERRKLPYAYDDSRTLSRDREWSFHDFPSHRSSPQGQGPTRDDQWELPEEPLFARGAKKPKTSSFSPENELPEYAFSDSRGVKPQMYHDFPQTEAPGRHFESGPFGPKQVHDRTANSVDPFGESDQFGYRQIHDRATNSIHPFEESEQFGYKRIHEHTTNSVQPFRESDQSSYKQVHERTMNSTQQFVEGDPWNRSYENFRASSIPLPANFEQKRLTPEYHQASPNDKWKWEGTIAKGGIPVFHAKCFPVGKAMETYLPEFLDCTAKTSLDTLAKHYYQATNAWVVFFAPANDPDITFYNEFMNYLWEKKRAAVAKLDDATTLFLVPPSEFSEKVLRVPGKLSISGLVLRLEPPDATTYGVVHQQRADPGLTFSNENMVHPKSVPTSGLFLPNPNIQRPGSTNMPFPGSFAEGAPPAFAMQPSGYMPNSGTENRQEYVPHHQQNLSLESKYSPPRHNSANAGISNFMPEEHTRNVSSINQGYNLSMPRAEQANPNNYATESPGFPFGGSSKLPLPPDPPTATVAGFQAAHLGQLASSLLSQQMPSRGLSSRGEFVQQQSEISSMAPPTYVQPNYQMSEVLPPQYGQSQLQQPPTSMPTPQGDRAGNQVNQQMQSAAQEEDDPQKRLQATLQLAAALLQQIQQNKGPS